MTISKIRSRFQTKVKNLQCPQLLQIRTWRTWLFFTPQKDQRSTAVPCFHSKGTSQEPPASSKAPIQDLKDMDVLWTSKIKIGSQNLKHWCMKDQRLYQNQDQDSKPQSGTSSVRKSPKWGLKGYGCSLHLQIKIESQNSEHGCIKDQWPHQNQDQDATPRETPPASSAAKNQD